MTTLKNGDLAPNFAGYDQDNVLQELKQYRGKKVVLFFYPKASTPGCTTQACNLRDNMERFRAQNYVIIGVSADQQTAQKKFSDRNNFDYSLIADVDKTIINLYGVWGPKKFMGREYDGIHRTTFVIDEDGVIVDVIDKVKTKIHTDQILK